MQEENGFRLGLADIPGAWKRFMDFGVSRVVKYMMDMERRDDGGRDERCEHRIDLRKLCFKRWVEKEKLVSNKLVKKDSYSSQQHRGAGSPEDRSNTTNPG